MGTAYLSMWVVIVVVAAPIVVGLNGLWLGSSNKAVFYHNKLDAVIAIFSPYIVLVALVLANWDSASGIHYPDQLTYAYSMVALVIAYNAYKSFRYNNPFYGVCVFLGRIIMSVVAVLAIPNLSKRTSDGHERSEAAILVSVGISVAVVTFIMRLVNKEKVLSIG